MMVLGDLIKASGWKSIKLISSYICAAIGSGVPVMDVKENGIYEKYIFIYSNKKSIYIGVIFAGGEYNVKVINVGDNGINKEEILNSVMEVTNNLSDKLPEIFSKSNIPKEDIEIIHRSWLEPLENKIYITVPMELREQIGEELSNYKLIYSSNHDMCIVDGLKSIIKTFGDI